MEMKRRASARPSKLARWLHRNLGLIAWYRYASDYGESYSRPAWYLIVIVALFALLFPLTGLRHKDWSARSEIVRNGQHEVLSYAHPFHAADESEKSWLVAEARLAGNSFLTALQVTAFQKELEYEPDYPWGQTLALVQVLLTSTLIALFLLAVRRQFRR
jgi:hypothetical protein